MLNSHNKYSHRNIHRRIQSSWKCNGSCDRFAASVNRCSSSILPIACTEVHLNNDIMCDPISSENFSPLVRWSRGQMSDHANRYYKAVSAPYNFYNSSWESPQGNHQTSRQFIWNLDRVERTTMVRLFGIFLFFIGEMAIGWSCRLLVPAELINGCIFDPLIISVPSTAFTINRESCNENVAKESFIEQPIVYYGKARSVSISSRSVPSSNIIPLLPGSQLHDCHAGPGCSQSSSWSIPPSLARHECARKFQPDPNPNPHLTKYILPQGDWLRQGCAANMGDTVAGEFSSENIFSQIFLKTTQF